MAEEYYINRGFYFEAGRRSKHDTLPKIAVGRNNRSAKRLWRDHENVEIRSAITQTRSVNDDVRELYVPKFPKPLKGRPIRMVPMYKVLHAPSPFGTPRHDTRELYATATDLTNAIRNVHETSSYKSLKAMQKIQREQMSSMSTSSYPSGGSKLKWQSADSVKSSYSPRRLEPLIVGRRSMSSDERQLEIAYYKSRRRTTNTPEKERKKQKAPKETRSFLEIYCKDKYEDDFDADSLTKENIDQLNANLSQAEERSPVQSIETESLDIKAQLDAYFADKIRGSDDKNNKQNGDKQNGGKAKTELQVRVPTADKEEGETKRGKNDVTDTEENKEETNVDTKTNEPTKENKGCEIKEQPHVHVCPNGDIVMLNGAVDDKSNQELRKVPDNVDKQKTDDTNRGQTTDQEGNKDGGGLVAKDEKSGNGESPKTDVAEPHDDKNTNEIGAETGNLDEKNVDTKIDDDNVDKEKESLNNSKETKQDEGESQQIDNEKSGDEEQKENVDSGSNIMDSNEPNKETVSESKDANSPEGDQREGTVDESQLTKDDKMETCDGTDREVHTEETELATENQTDAVSENKPNGLNQVDGEPTVDDSPAQNAEEGNLQDQSQDDDHIEHSDSAIIGDSNENMTDNQEGVEKVETAVSENENGAPEHEPTDNCIEDQDGEPKTSTDADQEQTKGQETVDQTDADEKNADGEEIADVADSQNTEHNQNKDNNQEESEVPHQNDVNSDQNHSSENIEAKSIENGGDENQTQNGDDGEVEPKVDETENGERTQSAGEEKIDEIAGSEDIQGEGISSLDAKDVETDANEKDNDTAAKPEEVEIEEQSDPIEGETLRQSSPNDEENLQSDTAGDETHNQSDGLNLEQSDSTDRENPQESGPGDEETPQQSDPVEGENLQQSTEGETKVQSDTNDGETQQQSDPVEGDLDTLQQSDPIEGDTLQQSDSTDRENPQQSNPEDEETLQQSDPVKVEQQDQSDPNDEEKQQLSDNTDGEPEN